jgi:hypothetical protein
MLSALNKKIHILYMGVAIIFGKLITNIGTILFSEFMYLTIVNEISSHIRYADYVIQLFCKLSTAW